MSKIICDVCGTTYPETAAQCPICGSAKPENPELTGSVSPSAPQYTYVKGGRFSEKNVRKRNKEKMAAAKYRPQQEQSEEEEEERGSNVGLIITIIILLLAIFAVLFYLYDTYLKPASGQPEGSVSTTSSSQQTDPEQTQPDQTTEYVIGCTGINLTEKEFTLSNAGDGYLLNYTLEPADTTDTPVFVSSDENVATVDANGKVTAVGPGSAVITMTCGSVQTQIEVTCDIVTEPPVQETTEPETVPQIDFRLNRTDFTLKINEVWSLYNGEIGNTLISWRSTDESVATVNNGEVKGVGAGTCTIYATYNGQEYACIVRVK